MSEELVALLGSADQETLPRRYAVAARYAQVLVRDPSGVDDALRAELLEEFSPQEIAEFTLTVTMAMGFSKAAISWGPPPSMPTLEVPTPTPGGSVSDTQAPRPGTD